MVSGAPSAASSERPVISSAVGLNEVMRPSTSVVMTASAIERSVTRNCSWRACSERLATASASAAASASRRASRSFCSKRRVSVASKTVIEVVASVDRHRALAMMGKRLPSSRSRSSATSPTAPWAAIRGTKWVS